MKVVISADMEGVCGVSSWVHVSPPEFGGLVSASEYERARLRLTREVNAAARGAFAGGASEVLVNDSHDGMRNLIPEELCEDLQFVSGSDKPLSMVQGVDEAGVRALLFVGYHARAGTPRGPLAHTWNSFVRDVRVNGRSTGEYGLNALLAGHYGVPVVFASGDDQAIAQIQDELGSAVVGVSVKRGLSHFSAIHLHPTRAQQLIEEGAERAVRDAHLSPTPYRTPLPARVELAFDHQARADQCERLPGIVRLDEVTVAYEAPDTLQLFQSFRLLCKVAEINLQA